MRGALAVLVLTLVHSAVTTNAQCSAPDKTLSFKCSGACSDEYSPCWRIPTNDSTECVYECYNMYSDVTKSAFTFLVPFKTADATTADMSRSIFKDNERLTAIDTLVLPSMTTKVSIIGGSYIKTNYVRGRAVTLTLAPDLVAQYPQVTDVNLANIDLAAAVDGMTTMLPATTKILTLNNDLLKDFPAGFAKLTALQELYVHACMGASGCYATRELTAAGWRLYACMLVLLFVQDADEQLHHERRREHGDRHCLDAVRRTSR